MTLGPTAKLAIDRKTFFDHVRLSLFGGFLSGSQVTGLSNILSEAERRGPCDLRYLAYRLATVLHETGKAMIPVREAGGEAYLKSKPYYPWVGMGLVQVTWDYNGKKFGASKPEDLMGWPVALRALFDGMDEGVFTGRKLSTYFNESMDDPIGARHIINGSDKAALIAGYHAQFLAALKAATSMPATLIASQSPTSPTPELDSILHAIADHAAEAGVAPKPAKAPSVAPPAPVSSAYLPPVMVQHPPKPALTFWQRVAARFGRAA